MIDNNVKDSVLQFTASTSYTTKPIHFSTTSIQSESLKDFFKSNRDLLLLGSGNTIVLPLSTSNTSTKTNLHSRWKEEVMFYNEEDNSFSNVFKSPENVDDVNYEDEEDMIEIQVTTDFLVFTLYITAILGTKLIPRAINKETENNDIHKTQNNDIRNDTFKDHEYQFVLLGESFHADGPPPLVWIFNQLTGIKSDEKGSRKGKDLPTSRKNHAFLRVWSNTTDITTSTSLLSSPSQKTVFHLKSRADMNFIFPSLLLKILPVPKRIIENQGSKALTKNIRRDTVPGIDRFKNSFVRWSQSARQ